MQYASCAMPVTSRNTRNASSTLNGAGVVCLYDDTSLCSALDTSPVADGADVGAFFGGMRSSHCHVRPRGEKKRKLRASPPPLSTTA